MLRKHNYGCNKRAVLRILTDVGEYQQTIVKPCHSDLNTFKIMKRIFAAIIILSALGLASCGMNSDYDGSGHYPEDGYSDPTSGERYSEYGENQFVDADVPSAFSVDNDGASYSNMRRYLNSGQLPPIASVRVEEYLNYFTFDYPDPTDGNEIALDTEIAACPWTEGHLLMRVGLKGRTIPESELPPSNYVFLIDVSGSMVSANKLDLLKTGFCEFVDVLGADDRIAIVTYANSSGVLLNSTHCDEKGKIKEAIQSLDASGSTAGASGITTAYEIARENFIPGGNNRIILGTDGDFNVGISDTNQLVELIEGERDQGIYITVLGVGIGNLNESMLEKIANNGNGTYEYLDNLDQMRKVFIYERNKFHAVAKDTKIKVDFNPTTVSKYRLIGYENRVMTEEEFEDEKKDAGEVAPGQTITALYEIIPASGSAQEKYASIEIRYKNATTDVSAAPIMEDIPYGYAAIASASENTRFAASVAAFGMLMKRSEFSGKADKEMVLELGGNAVSFDPHGYRAEFLTLVPKANFANDNRK